MKTSPNGLFVASVSQHHYPAPVVVIWNACTGGILSQWAWTPQAPLLNEKYPVFIEFSPDSTFVLFLDYLSDELQIRSTNTGNLLQKIEGVRGNPVPYVDFNYQPWFLDGTILLWEASTIAIYDCFQKGVHIYHIDDIPCPIRRGFVRHFSDGYPDLTLSRSGRWLCIIDSSTGYVVDALSSGIHINISTTPKILDGPGSTDKYGAYLATAFDEAEETLIVVTGSGQVLRWFIP